jgi:hypothetical protein
MRSFEFTCKSVSERQAHAYTSETVWDAVLLPNLAQREDADKWEQIAGGQIQLSGLASKLFEAGRSYAINITDSE